MVGRLTIAVEQHLYWCLFTRSSAVAERLRDLRVIDYFAKLLKIIRNNNVEYWVGRV